MDIRHVCTELKCTYIPTVPAENAERDSSVTRFLSDGFLHQIAPPGHLRGTLRRFCFLPKIRGDI